jgi:lysophospholipase L1-like esterase
MNTKPDAVNVLCFGDSNTWGQKPDKTGRYPADTRWTGVLQKLLGEDYYIIEEGLSSRTTDLDYDRRPGRNGKTYLEPCIDSHNPLDVVIIMLGSNDFKMEFSRSVVDIADALKDLVNIVKERARTAHGTIPKVILVSPILVDDTAPRFAEFYMGYYNHDSVLKSQELAAAVRQVAAEGECTFVDASTVAHSGEDGLHFNAASHPAMGKLMADTVRSLINT